MKIRHILTVLVLGGLIAACGEGRGERALSGAGIGAGVGAGAGAVSGGIGVVPGAAAGAVIGGAAGAITEPDEVDLGKPAWKD